MQQGLEEGMWPLRLCGLAGHRLIPLLAMGNHGHLEGPIVP